MNGTEGFIKTILSIIFYVFNDKRYAKFLELIQKAADFLRVNRKIFIFVIQPAFLLISAFFLS